MTFVLHKVIHVYYSCNRLRFEKAYSHLIGIAKIITRLKMIFKSKKIKINSKELILVSFTQNTGHGFELNSGSHCNPNLSPMLLASKKRNRE